MVTCDVMVICDIIVTCGVMVTCDIIVTKMMHVGNMLAGQVDNHLRNNQRGKYIKKFIINMKH